MTITPGWMGGALPVECAASSKLVRLTRRAAALLASAVLLLAALPACERKTGESGEKTVVVYTSADDVIARPLLEKFEKQTGIKVLVKGDTEATKTTGLVERLRAEKASGRVRADVFWSSEPFLTCQLAREGVLAPAPPEVGKDWPRVGTDRKWFEFAERARVSVARPGHEGDGKPIAIARPQFGTTRGHMAALLTRDGEEKFRACLNAAKSAGVLQVDGNSAVVRAVAQGQASVGLTDTDDVWSAQAEGMQVEAHFEDSGIFIALTVPNTAAMVAGSPHSTEAAALVDFLLSEESERFLMDSESHNIPVRAVLRAQFEQKYPGKLPKDAVRPDIERITDAMPRAIAIFEEVIGQ